MKTAALDRKTDVRDERPAEQARNGRPAGTLPQEMKDRPGTPAWQAAMPNGDPPALTLWGTDE